MGIRIIFFGTSQFAVEVFETLRTKGILPELIVTETDKPKGRGQKLSVPPVKEWAQVHNFPVFQPDTLKNTSAKEFLEKISADIFLVASYGKLLPKAILQIPKYGTLNIHPSLLPKYRGPSPISSAILRDDRDTGISIIKLDEQMDHGPIIVQKNVPFAVWPPDIEEVERTLAYEGALLFADSVSEYLSGTIKPVPQEDSLATFTKKIDKKDGYIDITGDAYKNWLLFKAYRKSPGIFISVKHKNKDMKTKITDASFINGIFKILRVIPENKREMIYEDFLRGLR